MGADEVDMDVSRSLSDIGSAAEKVTDGHVSSTEVSERVIVII